jgi:hypothetical protein
VPWRVKERAGIRLIQASSTIRKAQEATSLLGFFIFVTYERDV